MEGQLRIVQEQIRNGLVRHGTDLAANACDPHGDPLNDPNTNNSTGNCLAKAATLPSALGRLVTVQNLPRRV